MSQDPETPLSTNLNDRLNRALDGEIVPSSGFTSRVMASVGEDAGTPPPLAFPWRRALPAFGCALILVLCAGLRLLWELRYAAPPEANAPAIHLALLAKTAAPLGWLAAALAIAWASVKLCLRLAGER
ncbi:MAG TPA: hypothetical protein VHX11_11830 [Acidobacteriaceae bacterium]|jgi:hypothetical protein|nr:hypothetical protein [Acidobacteriaceae bacterium]